VVAIDQWLGILREALTRNYDRLDQVLTEITALPTSAPKPASKRKAP
jgi:hypothetical protein